MSTQKTKTHKIVPLGDRILIRTIEADTKTKSGIIIPDTVSKKRPEQGMVVAVGKGRTTDDGKVIVPKVKVGDVVIFDNYQLGEIKLDGEEFYILSEANILAVIK